MSSDGNVSGVAGSEDCSFIPSTCKPSQASCSQGAHDDVQRQILEQLQ